MKLRHEGYWLKGEEIIQIHGTHIMYVLEHSEMFGTTVEEIKAVYRKHHEPLGYEGSARWRIMTEAFRMGWIRVRHQAYRNGDRWLFEFSTIRDAVDPIRQFVAEGLHSGLLFADSTIELHGCDDHFFKFYPWREGGASTFLEEISTARTLSEKGPPFLRTRSW